MRILFVSSADSRYFPLLREWIASLRAFPQSKDMDIGIINAGLDEEQCQILTTQDQVTAIAAPDWPCPLAAHRIKGRDFLKACVSRPFIPQLFPGYDLYIWMDADTWLQDWQAVEWLIAGASKNALAICPQTDRAYGKAMRIKWLGPLPWKPRSFYYSNGKRAFSRKIAQELFPHAPLNAGVFALKKEAPHWQRWQELIRKALKKGKIFTAEQLTLGMLVYLEGYRAEFLPALCNWLCETPPTWNTKTGRFAEPYIPHAPIGIMHLSGCDEMRLDRDITTTISTTDGKTAEKSYRYPQK